MLIPPLEPHVIRHTYVIDDGLCTRIVFLFKVPRKLISLVNFCSSSSTFPVVFVAAKLSDMVRLTLLSLPPERLPFAVMNAIEQSNSYTDDGDYITLDLP